MNTENSETNDQTNLFNNLLTNLILKTQITKILDWSI